jgi:ComF family protein
MGLTNLFAAAVDFFFPARCLLCRKAVTALDEISFCSPCRDEFSYISGPLCPQCGIPFVSPAGEDHLCSRCISRAPLFDRARAVGEYEGSLRTAIHRFKYDSRSLLAEPLGRLLADQGRKLFISNAYDVILPVPLHPRRLRQRGFNQSLVLARQVGQQWGIAVEAEGLKRIRWTDSQTMLPVKERLHNVRGAFAYSGRGVGNKAVLLIDDVYTSGSTVDECARVMKRNGAKRVDVLTVARTI